MVLVIAGSLMLLIALLHVAIIFGGPDWYRFFGAGESMAVMSERGSVYPAVVTGIIASVLAVSAAYTFSAAGLITALPFSRQVLWLVAGVLMARGIFGIPLVLVGKSAYLCELRSKMTFMIFSSLICIVLATLYLIALSQK